MQKSVLQKKESCNLRLHLRDIILLAIEISGKFSNSLTTALINQSNKTRRCKTSGKARS